MTARKSKSKEPTAVKTNEEIDKELAKEEAKVNQELQEGKSPASESAPEEAPEASQPQKEEKEEEEEVDISQLSAKAQKRFQKLSQKAKEAEELKAEKERLLNELEAFKKQSLKPLIPEEREETETLPWDTSESKEITQEEYAQEVEKRARKIVSEELGKEKILNLIHQDVKALEEKYPELNPDNKDGFNQTLILQIADWYRQMFKSNRNLRLLDFVNQLMSLKEEGAEKGKAEVSKTLAKQAAEQAVETSGVSARGSKSLEDQIRDASSEEELAELEKLLPHA